jgi:hypothetical protein
VPRATHPFVGLDAFRRVQTNVLRVKRDKQRFKG